MSFGVQELMIVALVIVILHITGLWDVVMRGIRELRGERVEPPPSVNSSKGDVELSFRLLGLSPSAQWEDVERAYRQKAKIHHPDRGGDEDTMRALNEAYALIKRTRGR